MLARQGAVGIQASRAAAIFEELANELPNDRQYRKNLAGTRKQLAMIRASLGRFTDAERELRTAVTLVEALLREYPETLEYQQALAENWTKLGIIIGKQERAEESLPCFNKGIAVLQEAGDPMVDATTTMLFRTALIGRAEVFSSLHRYAEAVKDLDRASELEDSPQVAAGRAKAYRNLGALLLDNAKTIAGLEALEKSKELLDPLVAASPDDTELQYSLGLTLCNLAVAQQRLKKTDIAIRLTREGIAHEQMAVNGDPGDLDYRLSLASAHNNLGAFLQDSGCWTECLEAFQEAARSWEKLAASATAKTEVALDLSRISIIIAQIYNNKLGESPKAITWLDKALYVLDKLPEQGAEKKERQELLEAAHRGLANAFTKLGRFEEAVAEWDKILIICAEDDRYWVNVWRALALARAGDFLLAVAQANALAKDEDVGSDALKELARICAVAAKSNKKDSQQANYHAGCAVELLLRAVAKGYKDIENLKGDEDFEALRGREDFGKLLQEMEAKK